MTTNTASAIIAKAYADANKLSRGASPSAAQLTEGLDRLIDIINLEQVRGLKLFLEFEAVVTLVAGQQLYSFMPGGSYSIARPLRILAAAYWDTQNNATPLTPLARMDWATLTNRTSQGRPNQFFPERLADRMNMYLWQVPDTQAATGTIHATLLSQAVNPTISAATGFPIEWVMFLRWALASDLATGMPQEVIMRCEAKAREYREILESFDVEEAQTRFQPNYAIMQGSAFE